MIKSENLENKIEKGNRDYNGDENKSLSREDDDKNERQSR